MFLVSGVQRIKMTRLSVVCIALLVVCAYFEVGYAARIARSPQYFGGYGRPPPPPPPRGFGPSCGPDFDSHRGHGHHSHGHHGHDSKYDIPEGGSISISKTISISSGNNAQSSAGSSAGSSGGSSAASSGSSSSG
ncbi:dermokine-like [Helicoverpa zea]|uniref:dermokine-like n=1 Tax=Helicoverpa zea TaxID=7113 RepID=UPI001F56CCEB|nr:dermokine-like [Helicoverpa zea]